MIRAKDLPIEMRRKLGLDRKPKGVRQPNGWEREYGELLELRRKSGEIEAYIFEGMRLPLPGGVTYKPDFFIVIEQEVDYHHPITSIEFHEIKGRRRDGGMVRFKTARAMYPWATFRMLTRVGPGKFEEMNV